MAGPASVSTLLLRNVPLFSGLPEGQLALLTRVVGRKAYPRNTTIIAAGDPTDYLFYEVYTDQAALARHGGSEAMQRFFGLMGGVVDGRPEIVLYEAIGGKG